MLRLRTVSETRIEEFAGMTVFSLKQELPVGSRVKREKAMETKKCVRLNALCAELEESAGLSSRFDFR